jgi:hypothetical protein
MSVTKRAAAAASERVQTKALADARALIVANDPANPINWPLSPRLARHAGSFARGYSYTGQPS